jgi:hypothetical protein
MAVKFEEAAAQLLQTVSGEKAISSESHIRQHYDGPKKVFILMVSGDQAEHFRKVVDAVRAFSDAERRRSKQQKA